MKKAIGKRVLAFGLALALMITASATYMFTQANTYDIKAGVSIASYISDTEINFNVEDPGSNTVQLHYTVNFDQIEKSLVPVDNTAKEVVIITDVSGSMGDSLNGSSRLSQAKTSAISFLNDLNTNPNVKVSLIDYARYANVYNEAAPLVDLSSNYSTLVSKINSYSAGGGTNIGDALRRASYVLQSSDDENADQYVILLTDGEPTAFSVDKAYGSVGDYYNAIGKYYYNYGSSSKYVAQITGADYLRTSGQAEKYYSNYTSSGDPLSLSLNYSTDMATKLKNDLPDVETYYIGFTSDSNANKLNSIATASSGTTYDAGTQNALSLVYDNLATEIVSELTLTNVTFEETLPDNVSVVTTEGVEADGNLLYNDINTVSFVLNEEETHYVAQGISFNATVQLEEPGTYVFGGNNSSALHYTDLDGNNEHKFFDQRNLVVNEGVDPDLMPDGVLDVLELQPGRVFELSESHLEYYLEGQEVNLRQMSMNEFDGNIEKVNGKYDIVYVGNIEGYDDYTVTGKDSNYIVTDIDITNRKAADLIDYANSGQLLIIDENIFEMDGSKLDANLSPLTELDNVKTVPYFNPNTSESLENWYDSSAHRPRLTLNSEPSAYDGSKESYADDHLMSFMYSAFNEQDSQMETFLYIDLDGDGLYEDDEKVMNENVSIDTAGLTLNYSLDETFNGLMPWKLELVDTLTGAKDYEEGFTAYEGEKTIVSVLQLSPGTNRMNINSSFVKPLVTEDYEINVTYMQVADFDAAYAAWEDSDEDYPADVDGMPTVLNGNYDMIIFGFGDSYGGTGGNKDLKSQAAVDAVDTFIQTGQSILFTHDTAGPQDWINNFDMKDANTSYNQHVSYNDAPNITANFKDDMGFSNTRTYAGMRMWRAWGSSDAYKLNEGLITMYPYVLADNASKTLDIASTHDQYWEIDLEEENVVPWFTLDAGNFKYYPAAYYYTFTNGNITYSGTGHSTPNGAEEQEFFVNTMLKAARGANHAPTMDVEDLYEGMNIVPSVDEVNATVTIHDVDYQDTSFTVEVYTLYNDLEVKTRLINDASKETPIDITFEKPPTLDEDVEEFIIKVVVTDPHGAQGVEEYNVTHKEVPTLTIGDNLKDGYLKGDTIDLTYTMDTTKDGDEALISNINLSTVVEAAKASVTESADWSVSGETYSVSPDFTTMPSFGMTMTAIESTDLVLQGTYDTVFAEGGDALPDQTYEKTSVVNVKEGIINVSVVDNLDRAIEGATIEVKTSDGSIVATGTTGANGVYKATDITTDSYNVVVAALPSAYSVEATLSAVVNVNYENSSALVEFAAKDQTRPTIETDYVKEITVHSADEEVERVVHVLADGEKSKLTGLYMKKLDSDEYLELVESSDDLTEALIDEFIGTNASTNQALTDYDVSNSDDELKETPFTLDAEKPDDYQWAKYFTTTDNGYYAIYAINESGNEQVEVILINSIIDETEIPDSI